MRASHTLDIYGAELHVATTKRDWALLRRTLHFLDEAPQSAGQVEWGTWEPNGRGLPVPIVVIWVDTRSHPDTLELIDTCAHEATHAAGAILEHVKHAHTAGDEPHAYLVGWLTRWLYEHTNTELQA